MRVLHIYSGNLYGGVETVLATLSGGTDASSHLEQHFALCFEGRLSNELRARGARLHDLGQAKVSRPHTVLRARRKLRALLAQGDYHSAVCHSSWSQALFGNVVQKQRVPQVFWCHDASAGRHWIDRWASRIEPNLAICNSQFTRNALRNIFPRVDSSVLYCPVTVQHRGIDKTRAELRAAFDTPVDATVIMQASRLDRLKGHLAHLTALKELRSLPGWISWFVGGPQRRSEYRYWEALKHMAHDLGIADRVRFLGQRDDVPNLLRASDVYCQPNTGPDSFGIAFVEALATGTPVVTTAMGGAREIVNDSCGILVPPENARALADALRKIICDRELQRHLAAGGPARAKHLCDPDRQMLRLEQLLSDVTRHSRRRVATSPV
jgi:glycosyltransferase involved in cell wall biosynthesis